MDELDIVKFEAIEGELVGEYCVQPFRTYEVRQICYCWTKWCSSFEESKPFEGCWSLGCACCCCAGLV